MKFKHIMSAATVATALAPLLAAAQFTDQYGSTGAPVVSNATTLGGVLGILRTLSGWFLGILVALAVVFLVYAAFMYLTSGGEEESLKKAKNYLVYGLVAIVVGLLARGLVILIGTLVGQNISQ